MSALTATQLAPLLNGYVTEAGPPKTIIVPNASKMLAIDLKPEGAGGLNVKQR